jgi:hypothetical protein
MDLTTYWAAFWDADGNFYHIDNTNVGRPSELYKTHNIGVAELADGSIQKTFSVYVSSNSSIPPSEYNISIPVPGRPTMVLQEIKSLDKSPKGTSWFMSLVKGEMIDQKGNRIPGIGLAEFVQD